MQSNQPRRTFPAAPQSPTALVIDAHPAAESFNGALVAAYADGATSKGMKTEILALRDLDFELSRKGGYADETALEPDLVRAQDMIASSAHVVVAFPLWWGSTPALLKGFFDRTLLPGWAFAYNKKTGLPEGGLSGRSGRVVVTMDAPTWYDALFNRASARRQVRTATLGFCGLKPVKTSAFGGIKSSAVSAREKMLRSVSIAGEKDAVTVQRRLRAASPSFASQAQGQLTSP